MTTRMRTRIMSALRRWSRRQTHRNTAAHRWQNLHAELTGKIHPNARRTGRHRAGPARHRQPHWWNAPTLAYPQVGRAGWLTPAHNWRANRRHQAYQPTKGRQ